MFIGDGMSLATVTAARELKEQRRKQSGEDSPRGLIWDHFPAVALAQVTQLLLKFTQEKLMIIIYLYEKCKASTRTRDYND